MGRRVSLARSMFAGSRDDRHIAGLLRLRAGTGGSDFHVAKFAVSALGGLFMYELQSCTSDKHNCVGRITYDVNVLVRLFSKNT